MNMLFVCSRNKWRSRTAENIFSNHPAHSVRSAGTAASARVKVNEKLIAWADVIFVMEHRHKNILWERFANQIQETPVIVLDIEDDFEYMDNDLVDLLRKAVDPFL